jgi:hypothetical protein
MFCHITRRHIREIQATRPHVSDRPSDQSTQPGHLSHLDSLTAAEVKKLQLRPVGKLCFLCWYHT